jgi:16S rRNA (uracil1498-N3)-methyltransferase
MSDLPLFYFAEVQSTSSVVELDEDTRRHVVTVLRMQPGEAILLTNGKGVVAKASIVVADKKKLSVHVDAFDQHAAPATRLVLAISLLKNATRFEWMLEKVTEIGVTEIIPLICSRTERQHFRAERLAQVVVSACLQSRQYHFPLLHAPQRFDELMQMDVPHARFIAHCMEGTRDMLVAQQQDAILLIGPEGDFSPQELTLAAAHHYIPVSLGNTRLRTETAGIVGMVMMRHTI